MPEAHKLLLYIHVTVGFVSLVLFWVPIATRKGSPLHRRAGRWYANAMYIVAGTALALSMLVLVDPVGTKNPVNGLTMAQAFEYGSQQRMISTFLLAISILVFTSVRHGLLTLQSKKDHSIMRTPSHVALNVLLGLLGVALIFLGSAGGQVLFYIFAGICLAGSIGNLRYIFQKEVPRMEWMIAHMGAMIGAGIGSYTAFFVFGGNRFLVEILRGNWQLLPWVLPAIIGTGFTIALTRKYRKKFMVLQEA